jgi:hypothetical protein
MIRIWGYVSYILRHLPEGLSHVYQSVQEFKTQAVWHMDEDSPNTSHTHEELRTKDARVGRRIEGLSLAISKPAAN